MPTKHTLAVALGLFCITGCESTIQSRLSETQANDVIVALHDQGIGARKGVSEGTRGEPRYDVTVPRGDAGRALAVLHKSSLPRSNDPGLNDIFSEGGLVPTATEERARYVSAMSGELAQTIERIDGVLDARVHLAIPDKRMFVLDEAPPVPSASVLIKHAPGTTPFDEASIQLLVAGAIEGMLPEHVSVIEVAGAPVTTSDNGLVFVGPFSVASGSAMLLRIVLILALGVTMILGLALAYLVTKTRQSPSSA